ncbi:MAG: serine hydrolase domain-containing protein [Chloroflexota bacterium]
MVDGFDADTISQVNKIIQEAVQERITPAVALAVMQKGELLVDSVWGYLDTDAQAYPVTTSHYFDLASVTKLYTTVALLTLMTRDNLALDTPLVDIIPEFGNNSPRSIDGGQDPHSKQRQDVHPEYAGQMVDPAQVTIFHLLTHMSGLPPWRDVYTIAPAPVPPTEEDPISQSERWRLAVERLCSYAFVAPPDTGVRYSDIGLMLLGEVVARLYGQSLDRAIADLVSSDVIFNPVKNGISQAQTIPTEIDDIWRKRRIWGEVHDENACGVGGVAGHAGLFANAQMVAEFGQRWLARDYTIADNLYKEATTLQAQTGNEVRGLGWMLRSVNNSSSGDFFSADSYGHTGFTGTSLWIDPQRQLVVALLTNRVYDGRAKIGIHALRRAVHDAIIKGVDA